MLTLEVGSVGDENTMASVFCRDRRHVKIGIRGGTQLMNAKTKLLDGTQLTNVKTRGFWAAVHTLAD